MTIYPAIDLLGGKCVRLVHGDYDSSTVYGEDPGAMAATFRDQGAEWIHAVDLDGAKAGEPVNVGAIEAIVACGLPVQVGGGIRNEESIERMLELGVRRVILGSVLVRDAEFARRAFARYGDRIVAGIDAKNGLVATQGWLETSSTTAGDLAKQMVDAGARLFVFTDIGRDGTLAGPNLGALSEFMEAAGVPVIASGGVGEESDIVLLRAMEPTPEGVIVGKAIYEGRIDLSRILSP